VQEYNEKLDLSFFYAEAKKKGFENNATKKMLVDSIAKEKHWNVWILYYNCIPVGSVAAHSFDDVMGNKSYRILARTCVLSHLLPFNSLRSVNQIIHHQNVTGQFLIPICLDWVPIDSNLYITSNANSVGSQRLVHSIWCPAMEKSRQIKFVKEINYRNTIQTVWEFFPKEFFKFYDNNMNWIKCKL